MLTEDRIKKALEERQVAIGWETRVRMDKKTVKMASSARSSTAIFSTTQRFGE